MLITGTIAPLGGAAADYVAQLQVAARPLTGMVHVDNQAPKSLGYEIVQGVASYRFADARAGQLTAAAAVAVNVDRLEFASIAGTHGFDDAGTAFEWSASGSKSKLPSGVHGQPNDYDRSRFTTGISHAALSRCRGHARRMDHAAVLRRRCNRRYWRHDQRRAHPFRRSRCVHVDRQRNRASPRHRAVAGAGTRFARCARNGAARRSQPDLDYHRYVLSYRLTQQIGDRWNASLGTQGQWSVRQRARLRAFHHRRSATRRRIRSRQRYRRPRCGCTRRSRRESVRCRASICPFRRMRTSTTVWRARTATPFRRTPLRRSAAACG